MKKSVRSKLTNGERDRYKKLHSAIRGVLGPYDSPALEQYLERKRTSAFRDGGWFNDSKLFRELYLQAEGLKRYQDGHITEKQKTAAAIEQFFSIEATCGDTARRLHDYTNRASADEHLRALLLKARSLLLDIVGPFRWEYFAHHCRFSGGSSTEASRKESHPSRKWGNASEITLSALPYWQAWCKWANLTMTSCDNQDSWDDLSRPVSICQWNKVFTVVKNFLKRRTAAAEPPLNMFLQLGLGGLYKWCAQREGLLLPDAQQQHQRLAREGSLKRTLVTRDLRAASDSVGVVHIDTLWPEDHAKVICDLRSPLGRYEDRVFPYEKVSSMGNGYTFEVETLTFYVLVRAVCGRDAVVSVYGDDIIYPVEFESEVKQLFEFCGFAENPEKTFAIGPFRESCGGHYFNGDDVTPFYVERLPTNVPEVIDLHNRVVEWAERAGSDAFVRPILIACRRLVPRRYWGPRCESGVLWCEWDEACPRYDTNAQAWVVQCFRRKVLQQRHDYYVGGLLASLTGRDYTPVGSYTVTKPGFLGNQGAWTELIKRDGRRTAHADRSQSDGLEHSLFKFDQVTYTSQRRLLSVGRQWKGPSVRVGSSADVR